MEKEDPLAVVRGCICAILYCLPFWGVLCLLAVYLCAHH